MSDYDRRQYKMMLELLNAFDARSVGLEKIIADLEALLRLLEDTDKVWKRAFHKQWVVLEEVYAVALDRGLKQLPPDSQKLVEDATQGLRQLVQERIGTTADTESGDATR